MDIDWPQIRITQVASGSQLPTCITHAGDGSGRVFIVQQQGLIRILQSSNLITTPFLDISSRVKMGDVFSEQGLFSVAFPPGYSTNGHFYVDYTRQPDGATVVSRFFVSSTNANVANPASEQVILIVPQPFENHNGGQLAFGPDGYLYIGMGDGGSQNDPNNRAQTPGSLLGKLLRIDVESVTNGYAVPNSNPFSTNVSYRPEIWALGLRNPWRFSFDRLTGDLYIGDVGGALWEEIDYQSHAAGGGQNYGWRIMEGNHTNIVPPAYNLSSLAPPVQEYGHNVGSSVTGGFVSRGPASNRMSGVYFYGDFGSGRLWGLKSDGTNWQSIELADTPNYISTFGEDESGQLFFADYLSSAIYIIEDSAAVWPPTLNPGSSIYTTEQSVTVSSASPGATIHFTTDGRDPTESDPTVISGGFVTVSSNLTLKARAFRPDLSPSTVSSATYTLVVATPSFNPANGPITNGTTVTISLLTTGATVHYTLNGTDPDQGSPIYSGVLQLNGQTTLKAKGFKAGFNASAVQTVFFGLVEYEESVVTTVAGNGQAGSSNGVGTAAQFSRPQGVCLDAVGNLYVADTGNHQIRKVTPAGAVTAFAGTGTAGFQNGPANTAQFSSPIGVCIDPAGNVYVADAGNYRVRRIDLAGNVTNYSGNGSYGYHDGLPGGAQFMNLRFIESDSQANLYVGDWGRVRKILFGGTATTLAGSGVNTSYDLGGDVGLCVNTTNEVFAASSYGRVFEITPAGAKSLFAGNTNGYNDGWRQEALFSGQYYSLARDTAADRLGNIYVSDDTRVRKISPNGWTSTLAGAVASDYLDGNSRVARFNQCSGLCVSTQGIVYVADTANHSIRRITPTDWDHDGIPDSLEGGTTPYRVGVDDRTIDSDGDGLGNASEFVAGTDPLDASSVFVIKSISGGGNSPVTLSWDSVSNKFYKVQFSLDLTNWSVWGNGITGSGLQISITDTSPPPSVPLRAYRLLIPNP